MHIVQLKIADNIYHNIMFLLNNLKLDGLKIEEDKLNLTNERSYYQDWTKEEISNIGKIGFDSKSFVDDDEDYSKW